MLRPSVARFLDAMLRDDRDVYRIDEVNRRGLRPRW
jgi:hypothetical protein